MTGQPLTAGDGIYEDGEWISWDYLNQQIEEQEETAKVFKSSPPKSEKLLSMIDEAKAHYRRTRERSPLLGEIGELYAEETFGVVRHKPHTQGSDGRIGKALVEIKTITPAKRQKTIRVKRAGNFRKLIIVRIWGNFSFEAMMIDRRKLPKGSGRFAIVSWEKEKMEI